MGKWPDFEYHVGKWLKYDRSGYNSSHPSLGSPLDLGNPWRPLATLGDMLENDHLGGNISDMKRWHVTKDRLISLEIGAQQQADQCQNFGFGHNFCHWTLDCSQTSKKWHFWIIHKLCMSPKRWLYSLKWVPSSNETSAKISVLVTILWGKYFIVAK